MANQVYEPFGEEWEKEMMKMNKKHLFELLKAALQEANERIEVKDAQKRINYLLNDWRANIKHYNTVALDIVQRFPTTKVRD
jgi:hypothetical protein|tara:strand:+ start:10049 stop:10294 length:246 start_codon:yes stop_codon:yes gene_type:complete